MNRPIWGRLTLAAPIFFTPSGEVATPAIEHSCGAPLTMRALRAISSSAHPPKNPKENL